MKIKALAVSIVIPVYNEEHHLDHCLQAIAEQTVKPLEVIVVDNNSTDKSVAVAQKYPFVRIVKEKQQGLMFARNTGNNHAKGDIIGKLDADSFIFPDWVERLQHDFADAAIAGVTGMAYTNILPRITSVHSKLWARVYYWNVHSFFGTTTMWGANMAYRRNWWNDIKNDVCNNNRVVHEDEDISLLIAAKGGLIIQDLELLMRTNKQSYHYLPKFVHYMRLAHRTKRYHQQRGSFDSPTMPRLNPWRTLPGLVLSLLLGIPFVVVSLMFWPLDEVMIRRQRPGEKPWLD
jgi:glycosyltransferase involved in cell wall biosynthesis